MLNGARREKVLGTRRGADLRQEVTVFSLFTLNRTEKWLEGKLFKTSSSSPPPASSRIRRGRVGTIKQICDVWLSSLTQRGSFVPDGPA